VILLHGGSGFLDEFIVMFVIPIAIFGILYRWSVKKDKAQKKKEAAESDISDQPPGP
jgi:hypothetical protein